MSLSGLFLVLVDKIVRFLASLETFEHRTRKAGDRSLRIAPADNEGAGSKGAPVVSSPPLQPSSSKAGACGGGGSKGLTSFRRRRPCAREQRRKICSCPCRLGQWKEGSEGMVVGEEGEEGIEGMTLCGLKR